MTRWNVLIKAAVVLTLVWTGVWGIRAYAGSRKNTAERVARVIATAEFADWSGRNPQPDNPEAQRRAAKLGEIAGLVNLLDFQQRDAHRRDHSDTALFSKLSAQEKVRYMDLTVKKSFRQFMKSLDGMRPKQRKQFIEQGLKEFSQGGSEEDVDRAKALGTDMLTTISVDNMRAYFEASSPDTQLSLAPLIEMVNESVQGLRGNEFGHRNEN
ncbi:MAG: hypothetical protein WCK77_07245 [Verrucomicrobiota bacterium]